MADQTTPVTDDDRKAHEWADDVVRRPDFHEDWDQPIARAIKAHVPAPPKSLADELRAVPNEYGMSATFVGRMEALADRVEAVEKELAGRKRDYIECQEELIDLAEVNHEIRRERDELRAEVERLRKESGEEGGKIHESSRVEDEAVSLSYWLADALGEHVDDQDNEALVGTVQRLTERLTRERDHARAEVIRQQEIIRKHKEQTDRAVGERDEALAEVERLKAINYTPQPPHSRGLHS